MYIFDSSTIINILRNYYPERFPSFWNDFNGLVNQGKIISVNEAYLELKDGDTGSDWVNSNSHIFKDATESEAIFVQEIFLVPHFKNHIMKKQLILTGGPFADPFLVASAKINDAILVTQESHKPNSAKIPNICEYFSVNWTNLEGFMVREDLVY